MSVKKKIIAVSLFLTISCPFFSPAEVVDKILVIINDEIITQGELDRILTPIYMQYRNLYSDVQLAEKFDTARRDVLQKMANDKLLLYEAKRRKIEVEDREVKAKIDELRERFSTEAEFKMVLARENMLLSDLEKKYKERTMIDKLVDSEIRREISVSPNELVSYYTEHNEEFAEPRKARMKAILIRITDSRPEEAALELGKTILARLEEGSNFGLLAEKYSNGPYAASGGDMGWVREGELMPRINSLVFELRENEISGILRTRLGFHIFKIEEKMPARTMGFHEAKDTIERILYGKKTEEKLTQWIERLKEDAYIAFR